MSEADVALTDYLLALECGAFAAALARGKCGDRTVRRWFVVFFAAVAVASMAGGTVHGFFLDARTVGYRILWPLSLLAIGLAALAGWSAAAYAGLRPAPAERAARAGGLAFLCYVAIVALLVQDFWVALAVYLPASVFLLVIFLSDALRTGSRAAGWAAFGIASTFAAGTVQQLQIAAHPRYLTHNALYHLILAAALIPLFRGARRLIVRPLEERWSRT